MKNDILYNEKSHTKEGSHEFYTGAILPADLAILPVDTIDLAGNETTEQIDAQENVAPAVLMPAIVSMQLDAQEDVDHATGGIPVSWLRSEATDLPAPTIIASNKSPTAGDDALTGAASNDKLLGLAGNDTLDGAMGDDVLNGGVGNDVLIGGAGKDKLTGGAGADTFKFASANESTFWGMDTIIDFKKSQGDKIDLSAIDSNPNVAGNQAFSLEKAFNTTDATGQLYFDAKTHILYGSTDADSAPEFAITLSGVSTLVAADFVL